MFGRIYASRDPFWTRRASAGRDYHVYVVNNRVGIFALGYPVSTPGDHFVRLAEIAALGGLGFLGWIGALLCAGPLTRAGQGFGRDLLREVRTSFYRRLFLAFVAVAVIPVLVLAFVIRNYVTAQLRRDVEAGAARTAAVAQRVVEELQQPADRPLSVIDDDALVFVSQVIDQDISIFEGPRLAATSERDLFASGLLPTRTPDAVYDAIVLGQAPAFVAEDAVGSFPHLLAAMPIRSAGSDAILTVPLASREQEIERQIAELDRGIVLGVTLLILLGAGSGFYLAERIADPVKRLTRATQRIARGDFDAQVVARATDEFGRLVAAFNGMAEDLKQQRKRLERTHRLEAWAEMARQVAHEIKNPLTPVQLSAEHLLRVHADRGEPLSPVLEGCVDSILQQVRLLRRIASEFSSFAGSPRVAPEPTSLDRLVAGVLDPYRIGLDDRVRLAVAVPATLPMLAIDPTLVSRALTNVIENALHAMPGGGVLTLEAAADASGVTLAVRDTGVGLDDAALARIFEPYFSTRASGTGLGMAIARRNVELNGGTVEVASRRGEGTTVTLRLPSRPSGRRIPLPRTARRRSLRRVGRHGWLLGRAAAPAGAPEPAHEPADQAGQHVGVRCGDQDDARLHDNGGYHGCDHQRRERGAAMSRQEGADASEADVADHESGGHDDQRQCDEGAGDVLQAPRIKEDRGGRDAGCGGTGEPQEVAPVVVLRLDVETGEADGGRRHPQETGGPAEASQRLESPGEDQDGGSDPERDDVGEGIELLSEVARGVREPGDPPVEHVEDHRDPR